MSRGLMGRRPPSARAARYDDIRWGGKETLTLNITGALVGNVETVASTGHFVDLDLWPPRVVVPVLILTAQSTDTFAADGHTWEVVWTIGLGVGAARDAIIVKSAWAAPYDQLVLTSPVVPLPAKRLTINVALSDNISTPQASYVASASAFVAPYENARMPEEFEPEEERGE